MNRYILREYGSWGVMSISYLVGVVVSGTIGIRALIGILAVSLLINSKQALTLWMRASAPAKEGALRVFLTEVAVAVALLAIVVGGGIRIFLPYALIPVSYLLLLRFAGEHHVATEVCGFCLLSLASLVGRYAASGVLDHRLYLAVALFFVAGVFKVKVQFTKRLSYRLTMVFYLFAACIVYFLLKLPVIALLPLADNLIFSLTLYRIRLQATGWLEVAKGVLFLLLMALRYR